MYRVVLCCWKELFAITSGFSWQNLALPTLYSKAKLACYTRSLLTIYFCISIPYDEKDIFFFFLVLVLEGFVGLHRTIQLKLLWL